jgi:hypothetical protein
MKEQRTVKASAKSGTDWKRLLSLTDKEIRSAVEADPEARPTDVNFWKKGEGCLAAAEADRHNQAGCRPAWLAAAAKGLSNKDQRRAANLHGSAQIVMVGTEEQKGAAARRQSGQELAGSLGGAIDTAPVLQEFLKEALVEIREADFLAEPPFAMPMERGL